METKEERIFKLFPPAFLLQQLILSNLKEIWFMYGTKPSLSESEEIVPIGQMKLLENAKTQAYRFIRQLEALRTHKRKQKTISEGFKCFRHVYLYICLSIC